MTDEWTFDDPDSGASLKPQDCVGHLLLIWAVDYVPHSPTKFSTSDKLSDVIVVDVVDLAQVDERGNPGVVFRRCWWRPGRLIRDLRPKIGRPNPTLAFMTTAPSSNGGHPPYQLQPASGMPEAVAVANDWRSRNRDFTPSSSTPPPPRAEASIPQQQRPQQVPAQQQLAPPQPVNSAIMDQLNRLAQQSANAPRIGAASQPAPGQYLPPPPPQSDEPPF